jgi:hypothetical protein
MENMTATWTETNWTKIWSGSPRFAQAMKNRAYHEGIKCSPYEETFGCLMKLPLATSVVAQELMKYLRTEESLEDVFARSNTAEHNDVEENETNKSTEIN